MCKFTNDTMHNFMDITPAMTIALGDVFWKMLILLLTFFCVSLVGFVFVIVCVENKNLSGNFHSKLLTVYCRHRTKFLFEGCLALLQTMQKISEKSFRNREIVKFSRLIERKSC